MHAREPVEVIPDALADAVGDLPFWFVIGGQAVRCFCPYRPSRDVDFGVASAAPGSFALMPYDCMVDQLRTAYRRGRA